MDVEHVGECAWRAPWIEARQESAITRNHGGGKPGSRTSKVPAPGRRAQGGLGAFRHPRSLDARPGTRVRRVRELRGRPLLDDDLLVVPPHGVDARSDVYVAT